MATQDSPAGTEAIFPVRFFKIILKTNLQRIKIPNKFTRIYGSYLSNPVFLKTPDGTEWKVDWRKLNDREVWFGKGWKEFAEHYSLDEGSLVVFKYEGASMFDVLILGHNTLEIDYPAARDTSDDDEVEFLGEWPGEENAAQRTSSLNVPWESRAKDVAEAFISNNPFITLFIKSGDLVTHRKTIHCLDGYVEKEKKDVTLYVGENSWRVTLLCNHEPPILHRQFSAGWKTFAHENGLQPGDICVFELINREDPVAFQVHVTKHNQ